MPADSQAHPPRFRLWLRRQNVAEGPFSLRFEVMDGKGILRVARPGVLIDPPARQVGVEERLTPQQLRSTRFILVWDGGRARQGHLLNRLEEPQLDRVELDRWHELEVVVDGGFRYVVLPVSLPQVEPKPQKPKARRPSLSELRQALDSITVHTEDSEDGDSALASLTGPPPPAPQPRPIAEVAEAPLPGIAGAVPAPVFGSSKPVASTATYEVQRPVRRSPTLAPPEPEPNGLADAPTVYGGDEPADDLLALGEADDSVEDAESLALGEADDSVEESEALFLSTAPVEPPQPSPPVAPRPQFASAAPPLARPPPESDEDQPSVPSAVNRPTGAAAFYASFSDSEEEAVFSIDLPAHRTSTEHVTVRRGEDDDAVVFAREELPPVRGVRPPAESVSDVEDMGVLVAAEAPPEPPEGSEAPELAVAVPAPTPVSPISASNTLHDEEGVLHRAPITLVRHLRRKVEEQRARIVELEARVIELEAALRRR